MSAVAASSSSSHPNTISVPNSEVFDVFISFRGQDTRNYFTSHVHSALRRKQIKAFIDSKDLRSGDEISGALLEAIEGSKLYLVIFSPEYASSTWCLRELEKILQCRRQQKKQVIPVFHKVDPTHIRHQTGSFGEGFTKAKARAKEEQVQRWKAALKEAADLSGRHQDEHKSESEFIDELVEFVWNELYRLPSSSRDNSKFLFGIDPHVEKVISSLCLASPQVRSVGLWGVGGVGKTTIAEAVFDCIHTQFQSSHFFRNVREELNRFGEIAFWNKVLSEILEEKNSLNLSLRHHFVRKRLARKRVFIVFDDVESSGLLKLEDLLDHHCLFGAGSKILVTSRDIQVLAKLQVDETCEVVGLKMDDALKLFSKQAFHNECPADGFMELSRGMVEYAEGNPLALKVLGSALIAQDKKYWESELKKMKSFLNKDILDVLRLSFDRLDDGEKDIFLDVACLFQGQEINEVMESLKCSCSSPYYDSAYSRIINLRNKSLLTISDHNTLGVHYLLQEMSWKIEREQSKHRRLQIPVAISSSSLRIMSGMGSSGGFSTAVTEIGGGGNVFGLSATSVLKINKEDITKWFVDGSSDAIVNPANERMLGGGGADGAIHRAAGPELRNACYAVPEVRPEVRCPTGEARITPGFKLPSSHVIHTVGPVYDVASNPATSLKSAYKNSLVVAKDNNIKYIAFPAISCGTYGYPFEEAATVAISSIKEFPNDFKEVHFVLFADDIYNVWLKKAKELLQS